MPPEKQDLALLLDMLDSAQALMQMVAGMSYEAYCGDRKTRRAVEREIEIIGEAARGVSDACRATMPEIPWKKIVAQRHILAHEYGEVQEELVWRVAVQHIPDLVRQLTLVIPPSAQP